jgi:hypothetical protein
MYGNFIFRNNYYLRRLCYNKKLTKEKRVQMYSNYVKFLQNNNRYIFYFEYFDRRPMGTHRRADKHKYK